MGGDRERIGLDEKESPFRPRALRIEAAAVYLSLSPSMLRKLVANGELVCSKVGACVLFDVADLDALFERGKSQTKPKGAGHDPEE